MSDEHNIDILTGGWFKTHTSVSKAFMILSTTDMDKPLISTKEFLVNTENALRTIKSCIFQAGFSLVEKVDPELGTVACPVFPSRGPPSGQYGLVLSNKNAKAHSFTLANLGDCLHATIC